MRNFLKTLFLLLFCMFYSLTMYAANEIISRLSNNDGLSNSSVNTIYQDSQGVLWFGTWDGLNSYDGTSFTQYRPVPGETRNNSISNPIIRDIFEENQFYLWITTDYGINRLNKLTGEFAPFFLGYKDMYTFKENSFVCASNNKGLIVASGYQNGVYLFNKEKQDFTPLAFYGNSKPGNATALFFDERGYLWIQNDKQQLLKFEITQGASPKALLKERYILPVGVKKICYDKNKNVWFSDKGRLFYIDTYSRTPRIEDSGIAIEGNLNAAYSDNNELYIGTTTSFITLKSDKAIEKMEGEVSVLSILKGSQDILWIGTDGKGIYKKYTRPEFMTLVNEKKLPMLGGFAIRAIMKDDKGNVWVGSKGGGLTRISYLGAGKLENVEKYNVGIGLTNNSVLSIHKPFGDDFWIGTDGYGIFYYSAEDNKIKQLLPNKIYNPGQVYSIYSMLQTDPNTLYIGSSGEGLFCLKIDNHYNVTSIEQFKYKVKGDPNTISSNIVYSIIEDGNYLWVGTRGGGLNRFDKRSKRFVSYKNDSNRPNSLSSNDVISLYKDHKGRIWVGTSSGLNFIESVSGDKASFKRLTESHGLPNTNIHAILGDSQNQIWASTSNGLARIDPEHFKVASYYYEDGLQDNEFSDGAGFVTNDGLELYFGGINGFNIIHPCLIGTKKYMPNLALKSILVDNNPYPLLTDYENESIVAGYQTGTISFAFSVLDFADNKKCQIEYQLEKHTMFGPDTPRGEWINPGQEKNVILNKLTPGDYSLYVRYCNADQVWNEKISKLKIEIKPPLWGAWWAIALYISFLVGGTVLFYYFKRYQMLMTHKLELEKREKTKKEEIHQAKLRFFTNIAHEFSNSITLIYGAIEQVFIAGNMDPKSKKQLVSIKRNAERMHEQIQQLMEFRKAETGNLTIRQERVDVSELVKYTLDNFIDLADSKKIEIHLYMQENISVWIIDRSMLEKIIFNLLSNALKYTPVSGHISIKLECNGEGKLVFTCTNTGKGIKPEELTQIFNRFKVLDNFESRLSQGLYTRNGIGLALCRDLVRILGGHIAVDSKVNEYASFVVTLPQGELSELHNLPEAEKAAEYVAQTINKPENIQNENYTILIVDDQKEIQELITEVLKEEGYKTTCASNGKEALRLVIEKQPDLVISDVIMPEMDGIELVKILKEKSETQHIPVILLSSKSDIENQILGLQTGANMFLSKPFHPKHLKAAINRMLGHNKMMKAFADTPQAYMEKYNNQLVTKDDKEFMDKVVELLQENSADEDYNQDSLAEDLLISRVQLYRKIKQITQKTPGDFIRNFRIKQAERMLIQTGKTVQEIMNDCGFRNKAYFYREFAKIHNCSPKDFRMQTLKSKDS